MHAELTPGDGAGPLRVTGLAPGAAAALAAGDPARLARRVIVATDEVVARARAGGSVLGVAGFLPAMAGRFEADGDVLCFVPRFPFLPGTGYRVLVHRSLGAGDGPADADRATASFELEDYEDLAFGVAGAPGEPSTRVVAIHPSAPEIPRNQLKLYVTFSAPMSEGEVARRVTIRRVGTGAPIEAAFLPMEPELWDRDRRRVTVFFDPARIKRGLVPHDEIGYPLVEGDTIEVVVDGAFRDGDGRPLVETATRRYRVGPDVRQRVDPGGWRIDAPAARTRAPLTAAFDRPLDHALLQHCLAVVDGAGLPVAGRSGSAPEERGWSFVPDEPWGAGPHELVVDGILEDLAGNSVTRVFDRELARADHAPVPGTRFAVRFVVT